ncbi:hypothetical protein LSAT2_016728, partial [Lamellibrachia satsuma]
MTKAEDTSLVSLSMHGHFHDGFAKRLSPCIRRQRFTSHDRTLEKWATQHSALSTKFMSDLI